MAFTLSLAALITLSGSTLHWHFLFCQYLSHAISVLVTCKSPLPHLPPIHLSLSLLLQTPSFVIFTPSSLVLSTPLPLLSHSLPSWSTLPFHSSLPLRPVTPPTSPCHPSHFTLSPLLLHQVAPPTSPSHPSHFTESLLSLHLVTALTFLQLFLRAVLPPPSSRPVLGGKEASVSFEIVAANSVEPFRHLVVGFESIELEGLDGEVAIPITQ